MIYKQLNVKKLDNALQRYLSDKVFEDRIMEAPDKTLARTSIRDGQDKFYTYCNK